MDYDRGIEGCPKCGSVMELISQSDPDLYEHRAVLKCINSKCTRREWIYRRELIAIGLRG